MAFDSNAMAELRHVSADRYQRNGGGGAHKVYMTSQAYYDARGFKEMSPFQQACIEMLHRYRQQCEIARSHYALDILTSKEGFYYGDTIPF
jgi:hypothetical protein